MRVGGITSTFPLLMRPQAAKKKKLWEQYMYNTVPSDGSMIKTKIYQSIDKFKPLDSSAVKRLLQVGIDWRSEGIGISIDKKEVSMFF